MLWSFCAETSTLLPLNTPRWTSSPSMSFTWSQGGVSVAEKYMSIVFAMEPGRFEPSPERPQQCFLDGCRVSDNLPTDILIGCVQHDMISLCEPVIILYGHIPVTLAAWSLSFSSAACIILVECMIVLFAEQRVVTHHSVLFRLNGWLFFC